MTFNIPKLNIEKANKSMAQARASQELMKASMLEDIDALKRDLIRAVFEYQTVRHKYLNPNSLGIEITIPVADLWSVMQQVAYICACLDVEELWEIYCNIQSYVVYSKAAISNEEHV